MLGGGGRKGRRSRSMLGFYKSELHLCPLPYILSTFLHNSYKHTCSPHKSLFSHLSLFVMVSMYLLSSSTFNRLWIPVNITSVRKYWKILFYPPNTDTGTFYGGSTNIDTGAWYPKFNTEILVLPVFYSISILCFKPLIDSYYLRLLYI